MKMTEERQTMTTGTPHETHGDHVDYLHDGHRHAANDDQRDEH